MNGWRLRLFVGVERLLARLGLKLPGKIMYIGGSDTLPPPLSRDEEAELIARLDGGDEGVKSQLIERNLRLVVYIARRFENTGVGIEDLISIGTIGLIKAINTYQPAKNIKLATYASRCIENEILMHLRKTANLKSEVSFDEPLNTDWDGNELLLSDILGTESDLVMKPIEADVDRRAGEAGGPGAGDHHPALRPGRPPGAHPEGGSRPAGYLPVLHLAPGKAHHQPAQAGDSADAVGAVTPPSTARLAGRPASSDRS